MANGPTAFPPASASSSRRAYAAAAEGQVEF
jgi:hypothetical protein